MTKIPVMHATLGGSSAHRWMACPGSVRLSEGMPDLPSEYKQEGSAAHEIAARALEKGVDPDLWLDTIVEVKDGTPPQTFQVTITEEMVEAAQVFVDYVREVAQGKGRRELMVETRFSLAPLNPPDPMYGTADAAVVVYASDGRTAVEVIDFKYGQGHVVEAAGNEQMRYYALGVVVAKKIRPDLFKTTIVQPRAPHPDGIIRSDKFGWGDLVAFKKELFAAARATQDPDAPLNPGEHCRFCPALPVCPAQQSVAEEAAQQEFGVLVETEGVELVAPAQLTHEQLQRAMQVKPLIEQWLASVADYVKALTEAGADLGYKLVPKRGTRRWVDEEMTREYLEGLLGDEAFRRKLRSPAQAERALKRIGMELPEDLWIKVSSGTNLVPNDDPRPALPPEPSAEDEFEGYLPLVEKGYEPDKANAAVKVSDEIEEPVWVVRVPDDESFEVRAVNETDARREARRVLGVSRLPNHTRVSRA